MPKKLILKGHVQGVYCRNYCSTYARQMKINGSATNLPDNTVQLILMTDDLKLINEFIDKIKINPSGHTFFGRIDDVEIEDYEGKLRGEYTF
jgi:acylphosphatase